ncbi:hypothetical protein P691DRAFT_396755 [Macrolepiota fuliginosa MF-IS2]|uniref:Uncharacterized protein n=1 Tax=Macrolepiota fuliginosa MF-IS2 TaxID=1400762 RepID=A0A9P6C763_9AGAR|nr:hypothetical protein P691DRAFT_396755 [Macrolepiota fuliginosa MF-IS2]
MMTEGEDKSSRGLALSTAELKAIPVDYVPNLMPFHIEYNGPAPVSTYMKVEGVRRGVGMPEAEEGGGGGERKEEDVDMEGDGVERYVSAFRGRTLHGLDVRLPDGYSGLVLRSEGGSKGKGKEKGKRKKTTEEGDEVVVASGGFGGLRVWEADVAVDSGGDRYMRGLGEWTVLAGEVHRSDVGDGSGM